MKKNIFLNFALKKKFLYKSYLYYNLYVRNLNYFFKKSYSHETSGKINNLTFQIIEKNSALDRSNLKLKPLLNEDIFIKKFFNKRKRKGFYIDIGCYHPIKGSNTYLLYKLGWSGLNIDLSKISIDLFKILRPRDTNINAIISNKRQKIKFYIPNGNLLSPEITTEYSFSKKLEKHFKNLYKSFSGATTTWKSIEKEYRLYSNSVELLKIDIEGADLKLLKTINLKKLSPKLIMIEAPTFDKIKKKKITNYLKTRNYIVIFDNNLNIICKKK